MNKILSDKHHNPSGRHQRGEWQVIYDGGAEDPYRYEAVPINGFFEFSDNGSIAISNRGGGDNEFGRWMDSHSLFREIWKATAREFGYTKDEAEVWYLRATVAGNTKPLRYVIVPTKPITMTDYQGSPYKMEGIEAGLCLMSLAWNRTLWTLRRKWDPMMIFMMPVGDEEYQDQLDKDYRLAARCFPNAGAVLD
jgi:hypothetical protein